VGVVSSLEGKLTSPPVYNDAPHTAGQQAGYESDVTVQAFHAHPTLLQYTLTPTTTILTRNPTHKNETYGMTFKYSMYVTPTCCLHSP
jgi:hypothetical protein